MTKYYRHWKGLCVNKTGVINQPEMILFMSVQNMKVQNRIIQDYTLEIKNKYVLLYIWVSL